MIVYRLSKEQYAKDLSGKGAELFGGRWNSVGNAMIYCAESRALCLLEIAVHTPMGKLPTNYQMISIQIPKNSIQTVQIDDLPAHWNQFPQLQGTQQIGDEFLEKQNALALKVPSAIVPQEFNILLNPRHPEMKKVSIDSIREFKMDLRLFS